MAHLPRVERYRPPVGYTAIAIALGLVAGLAAGGRPANAARHTLRLWPALLVGAAAQWLPELLDVPESAAFVAVACSYLALVAFAVANLRLVGMPVVLVGLALNSAVIFPNGGMPVRGSAVVQAGLVEPDEVATIDFGSKRHLETEDDVLTILGDVVPVAPLREVISFGDLILAAGVADVVFRLLRPNRAPRQSPAQAHDQGMVSVAKRLGMLPERLATPPEPAVDESVIDLAGEERRLLSAPGT